MTWRCLMKHRASLGLVLLVALGATIVFAQSSKETGQPASNPGAQAQKQELPPGMSEADMKACQEASTPGPKHEQLAKKIGAWSGKTTMWMSPGAEPTKGECTS